MFIAALTSLSWCVPHSGQNPLPIRKIVCSDTHNLNTVLLSVSTVELDGTHDYVSNTYSAILNELIESEIRDVTSPETFHTVKVECLGRDKVKSSAKIGSKFEVPIFALVGDVPIQSRYFVDTPPPIARTLDQNDSLYRKIFNLFIKLTFDINISRITGSKIHHT